MIPVGKDSLNLGEKTRGKSPQKQQQEVYTKEEHEDLLERLKRTFIGQHAQIK